MHSISSNKNNSRNHPRMTMMAALLVCAISIVGSAQAAVLTYDSATNPGWFGTNAWGENPPTYDSNWVSGSSAVISPASNIAISLTDSTNVADLTFDGVMSLTGETSVRVLQMSGGNLSVTNNVGGVIVGVRAVIQGSFTFDTNGWLRPNATTSQAYEGTATVQTGRIDYTHPANQIGSLSNFVITGGAVAMERSGADMGTLTLNSGSFLLGRTSTTGHTFTISTTRLEGNGATARIQTQGDGTSVQTFAVNQSDNTTYAGRILGTPVTAGHTNRLVFQKGGVGALTLTGELDLHRTTTVSGGRLYINSSDATFQDEINTTAISVDGGLLGGTGTIEIADNSNVVLGANGQLSAGLVGSAGRTTYTLGSGTLNLTTATDSANTGWLHFALGEDTTPGVDYAQILLTTGTLNIGSGLNFNDFSFTALSGFGPGQYVLFDTSNPIGGSLGTSTGTIGGYDATLSIFNNEQLILSVIPEPGSFALLLAGVVLIVVARRRRV